MNILFLSREYPPDHSGGVGIYVKEMSKALIRMSHRVFVITEAKDKPGEYIEDGIRIFRVSLPSKITLSFLPGFFEKLEYSRIVSKKIKEVVKKYKIDVIESPEARAEGFWYYLCAKNPPLAIKLHTPEGLIRRLNCQKQDCESFLIEKLEEFWLRRADKIIGLSRGVRDLVCGYYALAKENIPLVKNPIDTDCFCPDGAMNQGINILYVGRLEFRKGVHILLEAIPLIAEKFPSVKINFIGSDCGMRAYLLERINSLGLKERVFLKDSASRQELLRYYQQASLCVVPSLWENHPYVILEAMACAKIVVAANVGGIPEIIQDGVSGLLFSSGSHLDLARVVNNALSCKGLSERIGENAREYIQREHSLVKAAEETLSVYRQLCQR
jgi:glycosyltransferase involved in cell wall biosynthesis